MVPIMAVVVRCVRLVTPLLLELKRHRGLSHGSVEGSHPTARGSVLAIRGLTP